MQHVVVNNNGKIWIFIDEAMEYEVIRDEDQMLTVRVRNREMSIEVMISMVYAKCMQGERLKLWESLYELAMTSNTPWLVGGDFNVICKSKEKLGGRAVTEAKVRDFNYCLNVFNLEDRGFKGSKYTWWNGRTDEDCIFKRLDRVLSNDLLQEVY